MFSGALGTRTYIERCPSTGSIEQQRTFWPLPLGGFQSIDGGLRTRAGSAGGRALSSIVLSILTYLHCKLRFKAVPRWSGLIHFQDVMNLNFTDGTRYEDISKVY